MNQAFKKEIVNHFHVEVVTESEVIFEGEVLSFSSVNKVGRFDILPHHEPFVSILKRGDMVLRLIDGSIRKFAFEAGILIVNSKSEVICLIE